MAALTPALTPFSRHVIPVIESPVKTTGKRKRATNVSTPIDLASSDEEQPKIKASSKKLAKKGASRLAKRVPSKGASLNKCEPIATRSSAPTAFRSGKKKAETAADVAEAVREWLRGPARGKEVVSSEKKSADDDTEQEEVDSEDVEQENNSADADEDGDGVGRSTADLMLLRQSIQEEEDDTANRLPSVQDDQQWLVEIGYVPGATVELHGIVSLPELNGKMGKLVQFNSESMRWEVEIPGEEQPKNLKLANLLVQGGPDPNATGDDKPEDEWYWEDEGGEEEEKELDECVMPEDDEDRSAYQEGLNAVQQLPSSPSY